MANNWRKRKALELLPPPPCRASLAGRQSKPLNQGESSPPQGGVSPERAIAPTHASSNFMLDQPDTVCPGCGSQPVSSRCPWPIARQLRVLSSQLAAASFCYEVRHPINGLNFRVHPSHYC
ncbi:hypothetical protein BO94DRAFT_561443 [Aspergillus sclerotioniger CBS 115572]|uniref:Uncharacterized protein n=1 Tax=Aspergillus sclerotioniger CBS 115572 TaxID=1450535 RepID=A0A317V012_9EURO|nr:hypothetical protein BO94DRAFT_561443 [Aspergillus sclerotioniger CBS 115572]PWY66157.1 hypothetical protein BO94DRAFT_561443 [Aspergillus sclerotioniger CBS 115572]